MLVSLELQNVGPAEGLRLQAAERLNLLTGDNGLGKTFLLDVAWWVLTRSWAGSPAWPHRSERREAVIRWQVKGRQGRFDGESPYRYEDEEWPMARGRPPKPGVVLYARVDGGFSVWDPARNYWRSAPSRGVQEPDRPAAYHFTKETLWNGLYRGTRRHGPFAEQASFISEEKSEVLCNGLVRDWVSWQKAKEPAFGLLEQVLEHLSAHDEVLRPGTPRRVSLTDARDVPTLSLPYGEIPLTHASAGVRRIVALAYLLVWAWTEHRQAASLLRQDPERRLVLLIDEVEAHLHPRWQRALLPALLRVAALLAGMSQTQVQILATTHAPLVLASIETDFEEERDRLFHLALERGRAYLEEVRWAKQGDAVGWLTSEVFGLRQARSRDAERAIEAAEALMRGDRRSLPSDLATRDAIHAELRRVLPGHDPFWPRWIVSTGKQDTPTAPR